MPQYRVDPAQSVGLGPHRVRSIFRLLPNCFLDLRIHRASAPLPTETEVVLDNGKHLRCIRRSGGVIAAPSKKTANKFILRELTGERDIPPMVVAEAPQRVLDQHPDP